MWTGGMHALTGAMVSECDPFPDKDLTVRARHIKRLPTLEAADDALVLRKKLDNKHSTCYPSKVAAYHAKVLAWKDQEYKLEELERLKMAAFTDVTVALCLGKVPIHKWKEGMKNLLQAGHMHRTWEEENFEGVKGAMRDLRFAKAELSQLWRLIKSAEGFEGAIYANIEEEMENLEYRLSDLGVDTKRAISALDEHGFGGGNEEEDKEIISGIELEENMQERMEKAKTMAAFIAIGATAFILALMTAAPPPPPQA